jgi:hypothetical protein
MQRGLRWAWPAVFAAAIGITISAAAQRATVTATPPREENSRGTDVTPELFAPRSLSGAPELAPPAPPSSIAINPIVPPRLAPVPGSQPIVPAPLTPPVEEDIDTASTDPAERTPESESHQEKPAQAEQPNAEPAPETSPKEETVQPAAPSKKPRDTRGRLPDAAKARAEPKQQKKSAPPREAREKREPQQKREAKPKDDEHRPARTTKPPMKITPPVAEPKTRPAPSRRQSPARAESPLANPGATNAEINAAFRTLDRDEQQRVRQRCARLLAAPRGAAANELRVCRAL